MQHYEASIRDQVLGDSAKPSCPNCGTELDHTGAGADELWECPNCWLAMLY